MAEFYEGMDQLREVYEPLSSTKESAFKDFLDDNAVFSDGIKYVN